MTQKVHSTSAVQNPEHLAVDLGDVKDLIDRADYIVELINMSAGAGTVTGDAGNAIAWGCVHIRELLDQAGENVKAIQRQERGASTVRAASDPLLMAIRDYEAAVADFNANAPTGNSEASDAYAKISYAPAMHALENWKEPASSRDGAIAALRLAAKEAGDFPSTEMLPPMLVAALGYFEQEGGAA